MSPLTTRQALVCLGGSVLSQGVTQLTSNRKCVKGQLLCQQGRDIKRGSIGPSLFLSEITNPTT